VLELKKTVFDKFYEQFADAYLLLEARKQREHKAEQKRIMEERELEKAKKRTKEEILQKIIDDEKQSSLLKSQREEVVELDLVPQEKELKEESEKDELLNNIKD